MKRVELTPLAVYDLSLVYSRRMEGKKIRHYRVNALSLVTGLGGNPFEAVERYIKNEEGEDTEVVLLEPLSIQRRKEIANLTPSLKVEVADEVLRDLPKVRKQLLKKKINSQLHQYNEIFSPEHCKRLNAQIHITREGKQISNQYKLGLSGYLAYYASKIGLSRFVPNKHKVRNVTACNYLSYTYEEPDEKAAFAALANDLKILSDRGLIQGHLMMPATLELADTVGSGFLTKVVFCFLFIDTNKLANQLGKSILELDRLPLKEIGITSSCFEGGIGPHIGQKTEWSIEEVIVGEQDIEKRREAVVKAYEDAKEYVNQAAISTKINSERFERLDSEKENVLNTLDTNNIEILDKDTGEIFKGLDELRNRVSKKK